jgi:spermidine synthase
MTFTYTGAMPRDPDLCTTAAAPLVVTRGDMRTLEFTPGDVQSEMRLSRPWALVLAYTRAMMCFALFVPRPRHIVMVGLGGGSLAKFCYRCFPAARITVIELRADVIALRDQFGVPPDDARFTVRHADALDYLAAAAPGSADVLMLDGFDVAGLPPALGSAAFYADCRRVLHPGGVLVANLFNYDPAWQAMLARLGQAFSGQLCWFDDIAGNNHVVFAVRGRSRRMTWIRRRHGRGAGPLHRGLAHLVVAWLRWRRWLPCHMPAK